MAAFTNEQMKNFNIRNWYDLSGKVAVVTGGATGLGLAITRCLISAGAKVVVLSSNPKNAEALAEVGDRAVFYPFNITDTAPTQEMVDRILAAHGGVDILVNNAGNH